MWEVLGWLLILSLFVAATRNARVRLKRPGEPSGKPLPYVRRSTPYAARRGRDYAHRDD